MVNSAKVCFKDFPRPSTVRLNVKSSQIIKAAGQLVSMLRISMLDAMDVSAVIFFLPGFGM